MCAPQLVDYDVCREVMDQLRLHHPALATTMEAVVTEIGVTQPS